MALTNVRELLKREITPEDYAEIRELWKQHSLAEDRRDVNGLLATLTGDCVYEIPTTGHTWHGHAGAAEFYGGLLGAFPDIKFHLTNIVIGPQGVCEEAHVTATHMGNWIGFAATGRPIEFTVVIFFPWDPEKRRFKGETVYFDPRVMSR